MEIRLTGVGKRFNREWIFRHVNICFRSTGRYAITGANGSGKSTLLQVIAGSTQPSEGQIAWLQQNTPLAPENVYQHLALAAPYLDLIEEMTPVEFLQFHSRFKPLLPGVSIQEILQVTGLENAAAKQIRFFSSGMKQRVKLAQAIFSDCPLLLLDEPCTNLDAPGYAMYHRLIDAYTRHKTVIVSSNDEQEYDFCEEIWKVSDFRP